MFNFGLFKKSDKEKSDNIKMYLEVYIQHCDNEIDKALYYEPVQEELARDWTIRKLTCKDILTALKKM